MERFVVGFWAWSNIVTDYDKGILNCCNRSCEYYGKAIPKGKFGVEFSDNPHDIDYFFTGEIIKETEKALYISVPCFSYDSHFNITKRYPWNIWIPKKCIKQWKRGEYKFVSCGTQYK